MKKAGDFNVKIACFFVFEAIEKATVIILLAELFLPPLKVAFFQPKADNLYLKK